jgi:hypothetical protein
MVLDFYSIIYGLSKISLFGGKSLHDAWKEKNSLHGIPLASTSCIETCGVYANSKNVEVGTI